MAEICLTFDNGPDTVGTPRVLEVLARHGIRATFFVLGRRLAAEGGLALARSVVDAGHGLGHHTYSHETPLGADPRPDLVEAEMVRTERLLEAVLPEGAPRLFRPFGGGGRMGAHLLRSDVVAWLMEREYTCVTWSSVPGDFRDPVGWVSRGLADCEEQAASVVVLHDVAREAMGRLDGFLQTLLDRGHTFTPTFPPACLPILEGAPQPGLAELVSPAPSHV